ncbi:MAG TPA: maltose alpha-D-glucosyltransferase [Bdellovibrio sp.]|uniref:maltose alpha-D-glucosyltransferase n=1 Tax=Bdellovibrio sp. TaxID=28201 RepID=UPI002EFE2AA6
MITATSNKKNPLWYKDAIIYQLHVRAFHDSNEDGIGDFQGLIQKLDYLSSLGITAIWLLPFYPSPLKDDGYDIADYTNINPSYGTMEDFERFLDEAHRRNIRVITELVINHTSDQHEWFQKSRRAPPGSFWRNFYVWSDDPRKYKSARIIFKDFETSNWAWDPIAKSYYWHRFYSHQPDLNFDNPEVEKAVFKALDFWMERGVDGMRLDAVPYLFEREGTSCENLPETHAFLKKLRTYIDEKYPGRMLLAEANQWPEDAVNYFGSGDECHMNFHFPLMPRLFMALKMEDRYSIIDILKQTPDIPENCQWATFLRNHDEMTLEMVTDEERDYMYQVYASDPRARINLGVRRRLAPLAGNDRRQIELLNSLLFSLPGSPIIYYGDEIGMGDNIYLGDRDGVRTPFQWSLDRNAGFSKANPQKLYLPVISTPDYHAETINVENMRANPLSLLWWMAKVIALRTSHPVLSRGKLEFIDSTNPKVLTYMRELEGERMICVVNLSRNAQFVSLDLKRFKGSRPFEVFGQTQFPTVTEEPYILTLGPYSFYWLKISDQQVDNENAWREQSLALDVDESPLRYLQSGRLHRGLSQNIRYYLERARWFGGKGRRITLLELMHSIAIPEAADSASLNILKVNFSEGLPSYYLIGLAYADGEKAKKIISEKSKIIICETIGEKAGVFYDALGDGAFNTQMLNFIVSGKVLSASQGRLVAQFVGDKSAEIPDVTMGSFEQSNTSATFGKQYYLKFYRKLAEGEQPEIEIGKFLAEKQFADAGAYLGSLTYKSGTTSMSLAVVQKLVENETDGWTLIVRQVEQIAERMLTEPLKDGAEVIPPYHLRDYIEVNPPTYYQNIAGYTLELARKLGVKTANMHLVLGGDTDLPNFVPELYTPFHQRSIFQSFRNLADKVLDQLKASLVHLKDDNLKLAQELLSKEDLIYKKFSAMKGMPLDAPRIRIHGDYHLGQVLFTGQDFVIIDFEGEPARTLGERKLKRSPLKDVAGMLRSFDYAAEFHLKKNVLKDQQKEHGEEYLKIWSAWAGIEFVKAYLAKMNGALLPSHLEQTEMLLEMFLLEKALYEVGYELRNRPEWVDIPLRGVLKIIRGGV